MMYLHTQVRPDAVSVQHPRPRTERTRLLVADYPARRANFFQDL
jgi:hypothetical protein